MTATVDQVRQGFATLRKVCDPQGHGLLDELENTCVLAVQGCDTFAEAIERMRSSTVRYPLAAQLRAVADTVAKPGGQA